MNKKYRIIFISLELLAGIIMSIYLYFNQERYFNQEGQNILFWIVGVYVGVFLATLSDEIKRIRNKKS